MSVLRSTPTNYPVLMFAIPSSFDHIMLLLRFTFHKLHNNKDTRWFENDFSTHGQGNNNLLSNPTQETDLKFRHFW